MFHIDGLKSLDQEVFYQEVGSFAKGLTDGEKNRIANMANISSLLYHTMEDVNWVGFYLLEEEELVLGPFHGKPACIRIKVGQGVCGTAVSTKQTQLIHNVHEFEGHIACDGDTNAEIVIPLYKDGKCFGVLDIDSPKKNRFNEVDKKGLEEIARIL